MLYLFKFLVLSKIFFRHAFILKQRNFEMPKRHFKSRVPVTIIL